MRFAALFTVTVDLHLDSLSSINSSALILSIILICSGTKRTSLDFFACTIGKTIGVLTGEDEEGRTNVDDIMKMPPTFT